MRKRRSGLPALLGAGLLLLTVATIPAVAGGSKEKHAAPGADPVTVLASGLENPRGIAVDRGGHVFVAEAGNGGSGEGLGDSGRILMIKGGHVRTLVGGLPSAVSDEGETTGPVNVDVRMGGRIVAAIGAGPQDVDPRFDTVVRVSHDNARQIGDIQAFRNGHPDLTDIDQPPNPLDSNAYGIAAIKHGRTLVTDAAGNDLLLVGRHGDVRTVAKFPNEFIDTGHLPPGVIPDGIPALPAESVPTTVAVGPDGYWYVGELKGFPFTPGASRIWRVAPSARDVLCDATTPTDACSLFMDGFSSIVGIDFGPDGDLYVVEIVKAGVFNLFAGGDPTGALWRIHDGVKTEIAPGRLTAPGGVAVDRWGSVYVTNFSVMPSAGEVLQIRQ